MSTVVAVIALGAALACAAHMLWRMRRGHSGCVPSRPTVHELGERQTRLAEDVARIAQRS